MERSESRAVVPHYTTFTGYVVKGIFSYIIRVCVVSLILFICLYIIFIINYYCVKVRHPYDYNNNIMIPLAAIRVPDIVVILLKLCKYLI